MTKNKTEYYTIKNILAKKCQYNMIIGERSNGKTYACLEYCLTECYKSNKQMAIIRRWREDFASGLATTMFDGLVNNGVIERITNNIYHTVTYYSGKWYFAKYEVDKDGKQIIAKSDKPFAHAFSITSGEHYKSNSYNEITNILFDECLTRERYLPDEFVKFMNILSTIIRDRQDVKIFMCGNTVNSWSPYYAEMGLYKIKDMKQGTIDVYEYGNSGLRVAVEFSDMPAKKKNSDIYFAFDNPRLSMITGKNGAWELDIYPHAPTKWKPKDIIFNYFIKFDGELLQADIVNKDGNYFTFIHRKTTEIKDEDNDLTYTLDDDYRRNVRKHINQPASDVEKKVYYFFQTNKVFYQDNTVGEIVNNYLNQCT